MSERRIMNFFLFLLGYSGRSRYMVDRVELCELPSFHPRLYVFDRPCRLKCYGLYIYPPLEFRLDDRSCYWDWVV